MMEKLLNQMNKKSIAENITFIKNYIITINNSNLVLVYRLLIKEWITLQLKLSPMLFFNKIQEIFKLVIPGEDLFVSVFLDSKAHSSKDVGFRPNLVVQSALTEVSCSFNCDQRLQEKDFEVEAFGVLLWPGATFCVLHLVFHSLGCHHKMMNWFTLSYTVSIITTTNVLVF